MYLTKAQNPTELGRFSHLKRGRILGPPLCDRSSPDGHYRCTLVTGHEPPHAAHMLFRQLAAVWDDGSPATNDLSKALDRSVVIHSKARELAELFEKECSGCAKTLRAQLAALSPTVIDPSDTNFEHDFYFIFCLLTDRVAIQRLSSNLR